MNTFIGGFLATSLLIPQLILSIQPVASHKEDTDGGSGISIVSEEAEEPSIGPRDRDEILWLARAIYSETKNEREMPLIGWVVRNRVENRYWGDTTYKDVVTCPHQFSGLYLGQNAYLGYEDTYRVWQKALSVAHEVYYANEDERPFSSSIQHFYSPLVVRKPHWADDEKLAFVTHDQSFAFYQGVR